MDYEKKYKETLERAKKLYEQGTITESLSYVFPQLRKKSEDEIVIAALKSGINGLLKEEYHLKGIGGISFDRINAWLEKQKPVEHFELKAGHWYVCYRAYCCRADHLTVKEGERFMCEKDGIVKGFVIKDPEKYFKECNAPAPYEDEQDITQFKYIGSDEVRRRSTIQVLEYARSLDAYNQDGKADIDKNIAWLEKQGEQKPAADTKVFIPKFRVGDIVKSISQPMLDPLKIISIDKNCYRCEHGNSIGFAWEDDCEIVEQKPAWSEEDEKIFNGIILRCKKYGNQEQIDWLKSLEDRYTWKPSSEQMEALEHFVRSIGESGYASPYDNNTKLLYSLLEQLKKLKGE